MYMYMYMYIHVHVDVDVDLMQSQDHALNSPVVIYVHVYTRYHMYMYMYVRTYYCLQYRLCRAVLAQLSVFGTACCSGFAVEHGVPHQLAVLGILGFSPNHLLI